MLESSACLNQGLPIRKVNQRLPENKWSGALSTIRGRQTPVGPKRCASVRHNRLADDDFGSVEHAADDANQKLGPSLSKPG